MVLTSVFSIELKQLSIRAWQGDELEQWPIWNTLLNLVLFLKRGLWRGQQTPVLFCKTGSVRRVSAPCRTQAARLTHAPTATAALAGAPAGWPGVNSGGTQAGRAHSPSPCELTISKASLTCFYSIFIFTLHSIQKLNDDIRLPKKQGKAGGIPWQANGFSTVLLPGPKFSPCSGN